MRCVSNDWCEIVNFQVSLCKGCNGASELATSNHLEEVHGIRLKNLFKIWQEDICSVTVKGKEMNREDLKLQLKQNLGQHMKQIAEAKEKLWKNRI